MKIPLETGFVTEDLTTLKLATTTVVIVVRALVSTVLLLHVDLFQPQTILGLLASPAA
jgi:hypothetical protein